MRGGGRLYKCVFAKEKIRVGDRLAIFGGRVLYVAEEVGDYGIQIDEDIVIDEVSDDSDDARENASFFNHSCEPNAGIKGQIFLVAMRDIEKDEEVTFDYAMCLHKTKGAQPYRMECLCRRTSCRKVITDNDWKIKKLQQKYNGWFSWFLQEKINMLNKNNGSSND